MAQRKTKISSRLRSAQRSVASLGPEFTSLADDVKSLAGEMAGVTGDIRQLTAHGIASYDQLDMKTKKRALAVVGVLAGLLAAGVTIKAVRRPAHR